MKLSLSHSAASFFKHSLTKTFVVQSNDKMRETELQTPPKTQSTEKVYGVVRSLLNKVESLPFSRPLSLNIHLQRPLSQSNDRLRETELQTPQRHSQVYGVVRSLP